MSGNKRQRDMKVGGREDIDDTREMYRPVVVLRAGARETVLELFDVHAFSQLHDGRQHRARKVALLLVRAWHLVDPSAALWAPLPLSDEGTGSATAAHNRGHVAKQARPVLLLHDDVVREVDLPALAGKAQRDAILGVRLAPAFKVEGDRVVPLPLHVVEVGASVVGQFRRKDEPVALVVALVIGLGRSALVIQLEVNTFGSLPPDVPRNVVDLGRRVKVLHDQRQHLHFGVHLLMRQSWVS